MRVILNTLIFLSCSTIFIGCKEDNESNYPKNLEFSEIETDFKMWVGGVNINTAEVNPEDIFNEELFQWTEDFHESINDFTFKFTSDDELAVVNNDTGNESNGFIKNDSIFLINSTGNYFIGLGNENQISSFANCILYGIHFTGNSSKGISTTSTVPITMDQMLEKLSLSQVEDLDERDTIAIMNYTLLYK